MAIHRGAQSALFYYLSCAPCADARYRKKLKTDARRGRAEREALEAEMPGIYRHPSPSSTNPHWQTEIEAGPAILARGGKRKNKNVVDGRSTVKTSMTQRSDDSTISSSVNLSPGSRDGRMDSKVHFQQFQRPNEEGSSGPAPPPRAHLKGSAGNYASQRNPQINDLHPATVTKINSRQEAQFLMRPPPTADFTSGRSLSARSRSDSGRSSRMSAASAMPFSTELEQIAFERRLRDVPLPLSQKSNPRTANDPRGQKHDRKGTEEKDFAMENRPARQKPLRSTVQIQSSEDSTDSAASVIWKPHLAVDPDRARKAASKPQLSTIASESTDVRKENRSSLSDGSLKVLQDFAPNSAILKTHVVSPQDLRTETGSRRSRQPSRDTADEHPELYDSWYTADFELPEWVHEHTKREVKHRWSMDI